METTETTKPLTQAEKRIAKAIADSKAKLKRDIAMIENEEEANEARKELEKKIKGQIRDFEFKYNVKYKIDETKPESTEQKKLSLDEKYELVDKEMIDGKPKYKLSEDGKGIIGANGEKITSIIKFDDAEGKKQTLGVANYFMYLKPETTKEQLKQFFPNLDRKK